MIYDLPPHLLQEYFNLQDNAECPFSKHKKHKRFCLTISFLAIGSEIFKHLLEAWLFLLQNTHLCLLKFLSWENKAEDEKSNFSSISLQSLKHAPIVNERSLASTCLRNRVINFSMTHISSSNFFAVLIRILSGSLWMIRGTNNVPYLLVVTSSEFEFRILDGFDLIVFANLLCLYHF